MKKTIISLVLLLIAICGWAQKVWENPRSFYAQESTCNLKVTKVDFSNEETVLHLTVETIPHYWFMFVKESYLLTPDGKHYLITSGKATRDGESDYNLGDKYDPANANTDIALHFEPLPTDVERFHLIEGADPRAFKIWNITDSNPKDMTELFNSNWRNDQTGDWQLGLYADNAVYDSKVWKYEEKNDKKVVLTDGQEKVTIAIGKEKAGKRQFTINGQKVTLSSFGSVLPSYPTADNTSFSTELTNGEATIVGWIKDFPKEISGKGLTLSANATNIVTGEPMNVSVPVSDEIGQFTMKVKLNGAQHVLFAEFVESDKVYAKALVLEPGKKYYMVHDWKNGCCIFMGENARLENELATNECDYEKNVIVRRLQGDEVTAFKDKCLADYDKATNHLNEIIAKNPNISKRYRDYVNEKNRIAAASDIQDLMNVFRGILPDDIACVSGKLGAFNPTMPMSLVADFGNYQYERVVTHNMKAREKYAEKPEVYFSFEEKGMLKLSDSDRELLKKWQQKRKVRKEKELSVHNQEQYKALMDELEKICADGEIDAFIKRDDVKKVYDGWAPTQQQILYNVIDSLHSEQIMRDYCRAYLLGVELVHTKRLRDVSATMLDDIKDGYLRQQIVDLKKHYEELARQNEEKVKNVIAPSSNVEGLTDGKAIIDKIIEPYKGKIVYMDIWGTWCQPCINAIKSSPKLKEAVKDYDIVYVYFAGQSEEIAWKGCIAELGLTKPNYVHYNLPQNQQDAVFKYLDLDGFPFYVLFDKQGNMEKLDRGHIGNIDGFKKKIDELSKK